MFQPYNTVYCSCSGRFKKYFDHVSPLNIIQHFGTFHLRILEILHFRLQESPPKSPKSWKFSILDFKKALKNPPNLGNSPF